MIQVQRITKRYEDFQAVFDLSFEVRPGEILGLVGPNGAGKTTTMRCICGIIPVTAGRILVNHVDTYLDPVAAKRSLAFIPADPKLFEYLTVEEHLKFFARLYGVGDQKERAKQLIQDLELTGKEKNLPGALSRGMKQKLMIACALIHKPSVMIFDEPFTGLDPLAIRNIKALLRAQADAGACIMISSHLLNLVEEIIDKVLIIQNGRRIAFGTVEELSQNTPLLQNADLEEIFIHATSTRSSAKAPQQAEEIERISSESESQLPSESTENEVEEVVQKADSPEKTEESSPETDSEKTSPKSLEEFLETELDAEEKVDEEPEKPAALEQEVKEKESVESAEKGAETSQNEDFPRSDTRDLKSISPSGLSGAKTETKELKPITVPAASGKETSNLRAVQVEQPGDLRESGEHDASSDTPEESEEDKTFTKQETKDLKAVSEETLAAVQEEETPKKDLDTVS